MLRYVFSVAFLYISNIFSIPFTTGEKLYFRAHWNNLTGGYALLEVVESKVIAGEKHFKFRMRARTSKMMDTIFKVRDSIETTWNPNTRQPLKTVKDLKEGYSIRYYKNDYDFTSRIVKFWQRAYLGNSKIFGMKKKHTRWREFNSKYTKLQPETQDLLTALYYMRSHPQTPHIGANFSIKIFDDRDFKQIKIKILKKEKVHTTVGSFNAYKVSTDFKTKGHFKSQGNIYAWVSDDKHRYPLKVEASIPLFGKVQVELVKIIGSQ